MLLSPANGGAGAAKALAAVRLAGIVFVGARARLPPVAAVEFVNSKSPIR